VNSAKRSGMMRALRSRPVLASALGQPVCGLVAQSVEHWTFNPLVVGSNPTQPTIDPALTQRWLNVDPEQYRKKIPAFGSGLHYAGDYSA
jgi:hypothetical protein